MKKAWERLRMVLYLDTLPSELGAMYPSFLSHTGVRDIIYSIGAHED